MMYEAFDGKMFDNCFLCAVYESFHANKKLFQEARFCTSSLEPVQPWTEKFWEEVAFMSIPSLEAGEIIKKWFQHEDPEICRDEDSWVGTLYRDDNYGWVEF